MLPDRAWGRLAEIRNAAWFFRYYSRGRRHRRGSPMKLRYEQAVQRLGLAVRVAFNSSDDFELMLDALLDSAISRDDTTL